MGVALVGPPLVARQDLARKGYPVTVSLLEAALQYAARGWRVIPVYGFTAGKCDCGRACGDSAGKHPRIKKNEDGTWGWVDPAAIEQHWRRHPTSNIGLATGRGLIVIDLDNAEQRALLATLWAARGLPIPDTLAATTGRGAHLYFAGELDGSRYVEDLLIRGDNSYVIAPPSRHRSGRTYQWLNHLALCEFPEWLKETIETFERDDVSNNELSSILRAEPPPYLQLLDKAERHKSLVYKALTLDIPQQSAEMMAEIAAALAAVPPSCNRQTWYEIGMALKSLGWERSDGTSVVYDLWRDWSAGCEEKFTEWKTGEVWKSFKDPLTRAGSTIGLGRLFFHAKAYGWRSPADGVLIEPASAAADDPLSQLRDEQAGKTNGNHAPAGVLAALGPRAIRFHDLDKNERPRATCHNTALAIGALGVECSHDAFHDKLYVAGHLIQQWAGDLSDNATQMLRVLIRREYGFDPGLQNAHDASVQLALQDSYDPVVDYLDGLAWDGRARLGEWLTSYMGADDTPLNAAIGRLALTAAVRRARRPGTKFDQIVVLEGKEGAGKSSAIEILAGTENYSDQRILTLDDRGQQEAVAGVWLYEIADLAGMRRAEVEAVKTFASRTHDRARPAYGRLRVDRARRCVFFATTNDDTYLKSQTGDRRFWPVVTRHIRLGDLARDRDQLWAEAAMLEASGASIVLPRELWDAARTMQDTRRDHDPWDDILAGSKGNEVFNEQTGEKELRVSSKDVLDLWLRLPLERQSEVTAKRAAFIMRRLGWQGPSVYKQDGKAVRGYRRPLVTGDDL